MELGIYVHIPFCVKKCDYCDFISYSNCFDMQERYVEKLLEEIEENKDLLRNNFISTIYIGGGTPSTIKSELIKKILEKIYDVAGIEIEKNNVALNGAKKIIENETKNDENKNEIEITIEVNPGTITKNNLQMYKNCGINRLSIGLQSTDDAILKEIGRIHNYEQFLDTYKWAEEAGFENINVDLMLGLPNQRIIDLKESLENVLRLAPKHISVYSLIVEEGTPIANKIKNGKLKLLDDELERNMYWYVKNTLELNGYKHYEISNFAKKGYESKHNMNCWNQMEYVGIGTAAHSYRDITRYSNTEDIKEYIKNVQKGEFEKNRIIHEIQKEEDSKKEFMLLGLRKIDGLKISEFKNKFGDNPIYLYRNELKKLSDEKLIIIQDDNIRLSNKGIDLANLVWEEFV